MLVVFDSTNSDVRFADIKAFRNTYRMEFRSRCNNFDIPVRYLEGGGLFFASKIDFESERLTCLVVIVLVAVRIDGFFWSYDRNTFAEGNGVNAYGTVVFRDVTVISTDIGSVLHAGYSAGRVEVVRKFKFLAIIPNHGAITIRCRNRDIYCQVVTNRTVIKTHYAAEIEITIVRAR